MTLFGCPVEIAFPPSRAQEKKDKPFPRSDTCTKPHFCFWLAHGHGLASCSSLQTASSAIVMSIPADADSSLCHVFYAIFVELFHREI